MSRVVGFKIQGFLHTFSKEYMYFLIPDSGNQIGDGLKP